MPLLFLLAQESFCAALAWPLAREIGFFAMKDFGLHPMLPAFVVTLAASMAGSCVNWGIGLYIGGVLRTRGGPAVQERLGRLSTYAYGPWSLLLTCAWLRGLGPPMTLFAGMLGMRFWQFFLLTLAGKALWYGYWAFA